MASAEVANKDKGEAVRQELKGVREKLEAMEAALARKEVRDTSGARSSISSDHQVDGCNSQFP